MADDLSRARGGWAGPIDSLLSFLGLERGLSGHTLAAYRRDLDQAAAFLARRGASDWGAVTGEQAAAWLQFLAAGDYAVASVARKLSALRMLARQLVRDGVRTDDFTILLTGPRPGRRMPRALSAPEVARLVTAPAGPEPRSLRDRAMLELFYSSGLRVSELAGLLLTQLDLQGGGLRVFGKGSRNGWCRSGGRLARRCGTISRRAGPRWCGPTRAGTFSSTTAAAGCRAWPCG